MHCRAEAAAVVKAEERAVGLARTIDLETRMLEAKKAAAEAEIQRRQLAVGCLSSCRPTRASALHRFHGSFVSFVYAFLCH
jgi:hypothetical protein